MNRSKISFSTSVVRASGRSILLMTTIGGRPRANAFPARSASAAAALPTRRPAGRPRQPSTGSARLPRRNRADLVDADGVVLLVDASEGPLPQTHFRARRSLRAAFRPSSSSTRSIAGCTHDGSAERDIRSLHRSRRIGVAARLSGRLHERQARNSIAGPRHGRRGLAATVRRDRPGHVRANPDGSTRRCSSWSRTRFESDYLGRIAIGRIFNGRVKIGDEIAICTPTSEARKSKVTKLY